MVSVLTLALLVVEPLAGGAGQPLDERLASEQMADQRLHRLLFIVSFGALGLLVAVMVTAIRSTKRATRENDAQFRTLADEMPALCWMAHADGGIFWYNRGWHEYTGTTLAQMKGWGWQSVHDPAVLPKVLEQWRESIATGKPFEMTFPLKGADGEFRPFLTRVLPLRKADGTIDRWFGTNVDISEERRAAERLEQLVEARTAALQQEMEERRATEEMLRRSEKLQLIGQLTGGIAHDFNNVLQVISSGVRLLKSDRVSAERKGALLDGMERAARNAAGMVSRLLAFASKQTLKPQLLNANEQLRAMSDLLRHTLGSRIVIETDLAPDIWPVSADPDQFEVALLNLALNARDAMRSGGTLTLRTRNKVSESDSEQVWVTLEDTGTGMPPAVRARIFEPFFTTKGEGTGTGLGLPQVQGFVKQSGGEVIVDSEAGQGTKITLCLPRGTAGAASREAEASRAADSLNPMSGAAITRATGKIVLVVDDNPEVRSFAATMLEGMGYGVRQADNAAEALSQLDSGERVDAVLSDVVMPGEINGAELASVVTKRYPRIAVVLATGYSEQLAALSELDVQILGKPYSMDSLAAALDRGLVKSSAVGR